MVSAARRSLGSTLSTLWRRSAVPAEHTHVPYGKHSVCVRQFIVNTAQGTLLTPTACFPIRLCPVATSWINFCRMLLALLFLCISGAFADTYNVFDIPKYATNPKCPPLYSGLTCAVPHCFSPNGQLKQRGVNDFYCDCKDYTSGDHCEIVECHDGMLTNSSLRCLCPNFVFGANCQWRLLNGFLEAVFICFCIGFCKHCYDKYKKGMNQAQNATNDELATFPAPEIRIDDDVLMQELSHAPPAYDAAVENAYPKYTV